MVSAIAPSCGICLSPLDGLNPEVNHGDGAPPSHAVHRDCLYDQGRFRPMTCLFRCRGNPAYVDSPASQNLVAECAQRVHRCMICHRSLQQKDLRTGPFIAHWGNDSAAHVAHRRCMVSWYSQKKVLRCPANCGHRFSFESTFTPEEQRSLLLKSKLIAFAVNATIAASIATTMYLVGKTVGMVAYKILAQNIDPQFNLLHFSGHVIDYIAFVAFLGQSCIATAMFVLIAWDIFVQLSDKVGRYFHGYVHSSDLTIILDPQKTLLVIGMIVFYPFGLLPFAYITLIGVRAGILGVIETKVPFDGVLKRKAQ